MLTKEQIDIRRSGIGGSDLGTILDFSDFNTSIIKLYKSKVEPESLPVEKINTALRVGSALESVLIDLYCDFTGNTVELDQTTYRHKEHNWMLGHIDAWVNNREFILECKTTNSFDEKWGEPFTNEMPKSYLLQCMWYAAILDKPKVDLAVLNKRTEEFRIYIYERDKTREDKLISIASAFWHDHVLKMIPPTPRTFEDAKLLFPAKEEIKDSEFKESDIPLIPNQDILDLIKEIKELQQDVSEKEGKIKNKKKDLLIKIGNTSKVINHLSEVLVTYTQQKRTTINKDILQYKYPNIYNEVVLETISDVLRIK